LELRLYRFTTDADVAIATDDIIKQTGNKRLGKALADLCSWTLRWIRRYRNKHGRHPCWCRRRASGHSCL